MCECRYFFSVFTNTLLYYNGAKAKNAPIKIEFKNSFSMKGGGLCWFCVGGMGKVDLIFMKSI